MRNFTPLATINRVKFMVLRILNSENKFQNDYLSSRKVEKKCRSRDRTHYLWIMWLKFYQTAPSIHGPRGRRFSYIKTTEANLCIIVNKQKDTDIIMKSAQLNAVHSVCQSDFRFYTFFIFKSFEITIFTFDHQMGPNTKKFFNHSSRNGRISRSTKFHYFTMYLSEIRNFK